MPKKLEAALKKEAKEKGLKGERADKYVYGTMRKTGWKSKNEKGEVVTGVVVILFALFAMTIGYFGGRDAAKQCLSSSKHRSNAQWSASLDKCLGPDQLGQVERRD